MGLASVEHILQAPSAPHPMRAACLASVDMDGAGRSRVSARDISKSDIQIPPGTNPLPSKEKWLI